MRVVLMGEPGGWHVLRLAAALVARGHRVDVVRWGELSAAIMAADPGFGPPALGAADLVVVRGMPGAAPEGADRLERVIFRMDVLARIAARGTPVVNPPRALEMAIDKYLSLAALAAAGVAVPRTAVVQDRAAAEAALATLGGTAVAKPLFGSRGRGLTRVGRPADLEPLLAAGPGVTYLQEFIRHPGWDARILVVGESIFSMRRVAAPGDWRTNVSRGGRPEPFEPPRDWIALARKAAAVVGAGIAGVDLAAAEDGKRPVVLEVNAVPGWRGLETVSGPAVTDAVADHLETIATTRTVGKCDDPGLPAF